MWKFFHPFDLYYCNTHPLEAKPTSSFSLPSKTKIIQMCWCRPVIPVLGRLRHEKPLQVQGQPGQHCEFNTSLDYVLSPWSKTTNKEPKSPQWNVASCPWLLRNSFWSSWDLFEIISNFLLLIYPISRVENQTPRLHTAPLSYTPVLLRKKPEKICPWV